MFLPRLVSWSILGAAIAGCQNFSTPPVDATVQLNYPNGATADLPHAVPGTQIPLAVRVTDLKGRPLSGIQVIWDDGTSFASMTPIDATSDTAGAARTTWTITSLPDNTTSIVRVIRAYVPGAVNNPIEYRVEVVPCSRCDPDPGTP